MRLKRPNKKVDYREDNSIGRIYVLRLELDDGTIVHKVGKSSGRSSKARFLDILGSFFDKYRYVPKSTIRLDQEFVVPLLVEKHLHSLLDEYRYLNIDSKVSGYSEMFTDLDEEMLLDYIRDKVALYRELLSVDSMKIDDYNAISSELDKLKEKTTKTGADKLPF